jgi:tetratricopeptide (TPR) repeat protein
MGSGYYLIIIILVSFAVYSNTLRNNFVFDDIPNVLENHWIKDIRNVQEVFSTHLAGFNNGYSTSYYRPAIQLIYMFNYRVFGLAPWGFHFINILLHAAVSVVVFLIASRIFIAQQKSPFLLSIPLLVASLFSTHPIHTEAVSWVAGVMDLSFTFFYLLSLYFYICSCDDRPFRGALFFSVVMFFLSSLCKEPALTLPFLLFAYDGFFRNKGASATVYIKRYVPYIFVSAAYLLMRFAAIKGIAPSKGFHELNTYQYVINVFTLFIDYMKKLVLPLELSALHPFSPVSSIFEPKCLFSIFLTIVIGILAFWLRNKKTVLFGFSLIVIPLLPALYIPGIAGESAFAERYLYLPSVGFVLILGYLYECGLKRAGTKAALLAVVPILLIAIYSIGTVERNKAWKDSYSLWEDVVKKSPQSAVAHEYFGYALYSQGRLDEAIEQYRIALSLNPQRVDSRINLGVAYALKGWTDQAIAQYKAGLTLRPGDADGHMNLGLAFLAKEQVEDAIGECSLALNINPNSAGAHNCLGIAYAAKGMIDKAIYHFQESVSLDPDNINYRNNLSLFYNIRDSR